jgi:hypothetical protein
LCDRTRAVVREVYKPITERIWDTSRRDMEPEAFPTCEVPMALRTGGGFPEFERTTYIQLTLRIRREKTNSSGRMVTFVNSYTVRET